MIFQQNRNSYGFTETKTIFNQRLHRFSTAFLAGLLVFFNSENPLLSLLTFVAVFSQMSVINYFGSPQNMHRLFEHPHTEFKNEKEQRSELLRSTTDLNVLRPFRWQ